MDIYCLQATISIHRVFPEETMSSMYFLYVLRVNRSNATWAVDRFLITL